MTSVTARTAHDVHAVAIVAVRTRGLRVLSSDVELEALRMLVNHREELTRRRVQTANRLHRLLSELTPGKTKKDITSTVVALRTLARRAHAMLKEARELQKAIVAIIRSWRPDVLEEFGVGPIVAATVLCAWSHPGRIHSEAAFAMLAGVAPIPANSGQVTTRYRLNRYGDRQLNNALHTVVQSRIQYQQATRDYIARRTAEGKTGREIKRCLARYVARDLYRLLENPANAA